MFVPFEIAPHRPERDQESASDVNLVHEPMNKKSVMVLVGIVVILCHILLLITTVVSVSLP